MCYTGKCKYEATEPCALAKCPVTVEQAECVHHGAGCKWCSDQECILRVEESDD